MPLTFAVIAASSTEIQYKIREPPGEPRHVGFKLINFGCAMLMEDSACVAFSGMFDDLLAGCLIQRDTSCCKCLRNKLNIKISLGTDMFCPLELDFDGKYHIKPVTVWSLWGAAVRDGVLFYIHMRKTCTGSVRTTGLTLTCHKLQPALQRRLILEKMQLHEWFMVLQLESMIW